MNYRDKLQALLDETQARLDELDILTVCDNDGTKHYADCQQSYLLGKAMGLKIALKYLHGKTMGLKTALEYLEEEDELQK